MSDPQQASNSDEPQSGLFKRYPKLSIVIVALLAYGLLFGMCAVVGVLLIRG